MPWGAGQPGANAALPQPNEGGSLSHSRPALLMVHGLLGPMDFFNPTARLPGAEVHAPDLPGYRLQPPCSQGGMPTLKQHAEWVADYVRTRVGRPVCLLGHSVGGAIAMLAAGLLPGSVRMVINVEGNFTLNDAFWCRRIAAMPQEEWDAELRGLQADPQAWLDKGGIDASVQRLHWARDILHNQSAAVVRRMAQAVVRDTGESSYLDAVRQVVDSGTPVHLLAGERSCAGWDVPAWVRCAAHTSTVLTGVGHMMMLEAPGRFCNAVAALLPSARIQSNR